MPAISAERKQFYKSKIRAITALDQTISQRELQERLESQGITLDRKYLGKLLDAIRVERVKRIERQTLNAALGFFGEAMSDIVRRAKEIADDPMASHGEVLAALREIRSTHSEMFQILFDAGVFERKLGTLDTVIRNTPMPEERKLAVRSAFESWKLPPPTADAEPTSTTPSG